MNKQFGICLLDSSLHFAALTRVHAGFGELRPPRCIPFIIEQFRFGATMTAPRRTSRRGVAVYGAHIRQQQQKR